MKKRVASLALALSMVLSFTCQAGAVDIVSDTGAAGQTQLSAVKDVLLKAGMQKKQFTQDSDYINMAKSLGIIADGVKGDEACTDEQKAAMENEATRIGLAAAIENKTPLFVNGEAQPIFPYTSGAETKDNYSYENSDIVRYSVYVETNYDTDGDGKLDLVKAFIQIPKRLAESDGQVATIYEARPYITGCTDNGASRNFDYKTGNTKYNLNAIYAQPAARTPSGKSVSTTDAAKNASADDWYYVSPYESDMENEDYFYDYEDLDWYDYFLVRGYAVVEVGGLGTLGSEGLETCGADVETDAFKCVIEWLTGKRNAYTDKENNNKIVANWSNGNVAMTGRSYGGTTDFAVASTGVEGLKTIVPVAGIASWYDYTNSQGISTSRNTAYSDNLGFFCAGRYIDEEDWDFVKDTYKKYLNRIYNDQKNLNGDYGTHWATRDYTAGNAGKRTDDKTTYDHFNCPALIVHGLNDDNVRTKQFQLMYDAFKNAGQKVQLLLHQGAHITPDYDSHKTSLLINGESYDGILNKWFSHFLYNQDNGAEKMATVTVQNNTDGSWTTLNNWDDAVQTLKLSCGDEGKTTVDSTYGYSRNWVANFLKDTEPSSARAIYTMNVDTDTAIVGTTKVHVKATPIQHLTQQQAVVADAPVAEAAPRGISHEEIMNPNNQEPENYDNGIAVMSGETTSRDALMMSAMLVDIAEEEFPTFPTSVTEQKTGAVNWIGGGTQDYDIINFETVPSTYKVIAQGWMDLANPDAGFDSASAANKVDLVDGEYYNYTLYLQPTHYTVKAGHKLALVLFTYDPSKASYSENYGFTFENAKTYAEIPVNSFYTLNYSAGEHGEVSADKENGAQMEANALVTLTATPDSGYDFSGWTVNGENVSGSATQTFTITENTTITANFTEHRSSSGGSSSSSSSSNVTASKADNGSVSLDKTSASKGSTVTVTVKPETGYKLDKLTVTDSKGNVLTVTDKGDGKFSFVMPEGKVTVTPTFVPEQSTGSKADFTDVKSGEWYADAVQYVADKGLMSGTGSDKFSPNAPTTRAMLMTVLARYAGEDTTGGATWYEKGMNWAKANGVSDGTNPNANITREQLVTMLYRYAGSPAADGSLTAFADNAVVSPYAVSAMQWAVANGIVNGSNGRLNPQNNATRAEVAAILMRFCEMSK